MEYIRPRIGGVGMETAESSARLFARRKATGQLSMFGFGKLFFYTAFY